jgi:hypothetical protein
MSKQVGNIDVLGQYIGGSTVTNSPALNEHHRAICGNQLPHSV